MFEEMVTGRNTRPPNPKKRSGRRVGPSNSHGAILHTARTLFGERGFDGTTMRGIAQAADVDSALIHHFFLSKEGLFLAAVQNAFVVPGLVEMVTEGDPEGAGERLARAFLAHWEDPEVRPQVEALIRSVRAFEEADSALCDFVGGEVMLDVTTALGHGKAEVRAALLGVQLIGIVYLRLVLKVEPLASMSVDDLVCYVAPTCQGYLTERL
ncbi:TetR family transcriptional regulator [Actinoplanes sp. NPDC049681]|uniref:TetR/AcrR family transcriptional regulator n=1 Tax=Actinoplanes sp. NPDC049681 TaxID=3363905 RepID=UPI0037A2442D